jgi:hypothetical protein
MHLDWAMDGDEGEDPSVAILDAIEEEFHRKDQSYERVVELEKLH